MYWVIMSFIKTGAV